MLEKPKLLMLVIVLSLTGLLALYSYAVSIESKSISLDELSEGDINSLVTVEGYIKDVESSSYSDLILTLTDYESNKTVETIIESDTLSKIEDKESLLPGAKIKVHGVVEEYKGELQIRISSSDGLEVLQKPGLESIPLDILLDRPYLYEGAIVSVNGTVHEVQGMSSAFQFELKGSGGYSIHCYITDIDEPLRDRDGKLIYEGDHVKITGTFKYYANKAIFEIFSNQGNEALEKFD